MTPIIYLGDEPIPNERFVKFLGVWFDDRLNWKKQINDLIKKARRSSFLLKTIYKGRTAIKPSTLLNLYKALVLSKLDYGCIVMADHSKTALKKLETVQNDILRSITKTRMSTPSAALNLETGIIPLNARRQGLGENYLIKLTQLAQHLKCDVNGT